jgi:hypothetical protein
MYCELAQKYTDYVQRSSPAAAYEIERIHERFGAKAAFQAAFLLVFARQYFVRHGFLPSALFVHLGYIDFINAAPEARAMFERAERAFCAQVCCAD